MKMYLIICALVSIFIYLILSIYVIRHKGDKKTLIRDIPLLLGFYFTLLFSGLFVFVGLSIAYSVAFQDIEVIGASKGFAILFGILFAYFPVGLLIGQLKNFIYGTISTCVQTYR